MSTPIQAEHFTSAIYTLLDETFDNVQGTIWIKARRCSKHWRRFPPKKPRCRWAASVPPWPRK